MHRIVMPLAAVALALAVADWVSGLMGGVEALLRNLP